MNQQTKSTTTDILDQWQVTARQTLSGAISDLVDAAQETFLEYADKAENDLIRTMFFSAYREVRTQGQFFSSDFMTALDQVFQRFMTADAPHPKSEIEVLSLVNNDFFERALILETIAQRAMLAHHEAYTGLRYRLATLTQRKMITGEDLPAGPMQLAEVFEKCSNTLDLEQEARLALYTLSEVFLVERMAPLHQQLDNDLKAAGILPDLKIHELSTHGQTPGKEPQDIQKAAEEQVAETPSPDHDSLGDEVLHRIRDLLSMQRSNRRAVDPAMAASKAEISRAVTAAAGFADGGIPLPHDDLLDIGAPIPNITKQSLEDTRVALGVQRQSIIDNIGPDRLDSFSQDIIEIIGGIFEVMLEDEQLPNAVKALLSHLHTPYLKIAINDPTILNNMDHPARLLLDEMVAGGINWTSDQDLKHGLFPWLRETTQLMLHAKLLEEDDIADIRERLSDQIKKLQEQQTHFRKRAVEKEQGRSMLQLAQNITQMEMEDLQSKHGGNAYCSDLLDATWRNYLTMTLVRNKCDLQSEDWHTAQQLGKQICDTVCQLEDGTPPGQQDLDQLTARLIDKVGQLTPQNKAWVQQLVGKLHAPRHDTTAKAAVAAKPPEAQDLDLHPEKIKFENLSAEERRLAEDLMTLPEDTAIFIRPQGDEPGRMLKLAWYNHVTRHFLLVDASGKRQERLSLCEMALGIRDAKIEIQEEEKPSFFTRAMQAFQTLLEKKKKKKKG